MLRVFNLQHPFFHLHTRGLLMHDSKKRDAEVLKDDKVLIVESKRLTDKDLGVNWTQVRVAAIREVFSR
jgi:hypothetical protein